MDKGTQVYAHQPKVGTGLGHLAVLQQINLLEWINDDGFHVTLIWPKERNGYICVT